MNGKFLLVAINSKYIHSNLAVYCLKNAAKPYDDKVSIAEYSINNRPEDILREIYLINPEVVGFSCYIWNIEMVKELIIELQKLLPQINIWLGGPEVSYNPQDYLNYFPIAGVMKGEGEAVFKELVACYMENRYEEIHKIPGISMRVGENVYDNPCPPPIELDAPIPYNLDTLNNKIIYYESSRGCPFSCSYCLSSVDKRLRFRQMEVVKKDLQTFIDKGVKLVKFIDRTFNCNREHAYEILRFIRDKDRGITSFHMEIAADILDEEGLVLLNSLRPGLVQLEIGVQSTNTDTIKAIHRNMKLDKVRANVARIKSVGNIHIHLDLIAGLPYEDMDSFRRSFNDIYAMKPDQLQLGFLKLLHGSLMKEEQKKYDIITHSKPPYEVMSTRFLSYNDILLLKTVENVVEMFYNSGMFVTSIRYLEGYATSPFLLYEKLGSLYDKRYPMGSLPGRNDKYRLLYDYGAETLETEELEVFRELLKYDMLSRDNLKSPPDFIHMNVDMNLKARRLFGDKKLTKAEHVEVFGINIPHYISTGEVVTGEFPMYFNYLERDVLTGNAIVNSAHSKEMENNNEKNSSNN